MRDSQPVSPGGDGGYVVRRSVAGSRRLQGREPRLGHLDIELTERCNNACMHCCINLPANDTCAQARELTTAEWQAVLRQAAGLGALSVRFTGGEPLLREDFADLYIFARRLGLRVVLFTNGRRITPQLADLLARVPPLERIEITVYGMRPESYDAAACAPGGYEEFRRGVARLLEKGIPFVVKGALLPPNRNEIDGFEAWAARIPWMKDGPPSYAMSFGLRGRREPEARNRLIARLRLSPEEVLEVLTRQPEEYRREMAEFCARFMGPPGDLLFGCGAARRGSVDAYGRLQPCISLRAPELTYDLRSGSLEDALTNFFPRLREMRATNPDYLARCARCFLKGLCEQCPAKSWAEHGTLDTPVEYLCQVAHVQARYLGLLADGEQAWHVTDWRERLKRFSGQEPAPRA